MAVKSFAQAAARGNSNGNNVAYKDKQKPTDIRFSNIQAGKSKFSPPEFAIFLPEHFTSTYLYEQVLPMPFERAWARGAWTRWSRPVAAPSPSPTTELPSWSRWRFSIRPHKWYDFEAFYNVSFRKIIVWLSGLDVCFSFQLVELSQAQDVQAGDGTTSVVVVAGALLEAAAKLLSRGIFYGIFHDLDGWILWCHLFVGLHPTVISDAFQHAAEVSVDILKKMSQSVDLKDRAQLIKIAKTSLNSKVTFCPEVGGCLEQLLAFSVAWMFSLKRLIDRLIDWLTATCEPSIDWLIDWLVCLEWLETHDWLIDWLITKYFLSLETFIYLVVPFSGCFPVLWPIGPYCRWCCAESDWPGCSHCCWSEGYQNRANFGVTCSFLMLIFCIRNFLIGKTTDSYRSTVDESELVDGLVLTQRAQGPPDAPRRVEKAKVALIQFCLSPPKTDVRS